jgi:hypothetical protein
MGYMIYATIEMSVKYANKKGVYSGINLTAITAILCRFDRVNNPIIANFNMDYTIKSKGEIIASVSDTFSWSCDYEEFEGNYPAKFSMTFKYTDYPSFTTHKILPLLLDFNFENTKQSRSPSGTEITHYEVKYIEAK